MTPIIFVACTCLPTLNSHLHNLYFICKHKISYNKERSQEKQYGGWIRQSLYGSNPCQVTKGQNKLTQNNQIMANQVEHLRFPTGRKLY
ncbi:hypothetical protein HanXRQr2_Chr08g0340991 [Helianthus annuus]|uniref:Uncharacterized protein n=1 Tax=Helianthus annuus TaxID=4232 RepID=A0A9K3IEP7_HELAN|nr:hypothetical protein HanXRQr2_Chr08g0340991 [Helianthus annuus]